MNEHEQHERSWMDRIRHRLWLDGTQRTDDSEANRGFYPGGMPVYVNRKPVGWRFTLVVVAIGIVIALAILAVRDADAQSTEEGQRLVFEKPGFAVTVPADWSVVEGESWEETCGDTVWASAGLGDAWEWSQSCAFLTSHCLSGSMVSWPPAGATDAPKTEWIDLPAGRARYLEDDQLLRLEPPVLNSYYRFERGVRGYVISCVAEEPPEDRWRSIAESFEFLRDEREVVVPRPDVTVELPQEWIVREAFGQAAATYGWANVLWAGDGDSTCTLQYDSRLPRPDGPATADEIHADYLRWLKARRGEVTGSTEVALPIGRALRTDWVSEGLEDQMWFSSYEFQAGDAHMRFVCRAESPPDDHWLSLGETITPADSETAP